MASLFFFSFSIALFDKSMLGFNVTAQTFSYDNRAVVPLMNMPFSQWWMVSIYSVTFLVFDF